VGWAFFRAQNLDQATAFLKAMAGAAVGDATQWHIDLFLNPKMELIFVIAAIAATPLIPSINQWRKKRLDLAPSLLLGPGVDALVGLVATPTILVLSCMSLASGSYNPFIYFQF